MIELQNITKRFSMGVAALDGIDLAIREGEFVAVIGPSGSGKSTLMNILGCLDTPTSGSYKLCGEEVSKLSEVELAQTRNKRIGFVFQGFQLLRGLTAEENVELPLVYAGVDTHERRERARLMLEKVGLSGRRRHKPTQLSGGQQQRVAIARALINEPTVILADEPTGNLDSSSGRDVMRILDSLHQQGHTLVLITHDGKIAEHADRRLTICDGKLEVECRYS